ncbi:hypothetical protein [Dyella choica]|uniref:Uncharacterized protein n=1 Tax=Dyella choica TaxID=1927959 RepID=A0A3S0Q5L1_9GAMM|nr:hypothetical protein [Dyella choica]RUL77532.1 hypothetical protein EKH80_06495 [Dyella choica]
MEKRTKNPSVAREPESELQGKPSGPETELLGALEKAVADAQGLLGATSNPSWPYVIEALKDPQVQSHFIEHLLDAEVFRTAYCLNGESDPDEARIVFEFSCTERKISLFAPRFLVHFNIATRQVSQIEDPAPMRIPVGGSMPGMQYCLY